MANQGTSVIATAAAAPTSNTNIESVRESQPVSSSEPPLPPQRKKTSPASSSSSSVHLVVQRYRSCRVLLRETEWVAVGSSIIDDKNDDSNNGSSQHSHCGLLVYVSFAATANKAAVRQAAQTVLNLAVLTTGQWGDGVSTTSSLLQLATAADNSNAASLVIVPQANLISKVKNKGKSIQYHGQIEKSAGEELYLYFCDYVRGLVLREQYQHQCQSQNSVQQPTRPLPNWYKPWMDDASLQSPNSASNSNNNNNSNHKQQAHPSVPPDQLLRESTKYGSWNDDATGMPVTDSAGELLTKSALKKLRKLLDVHAAKHEKWKATTCNHPTSDKTYPVKGSAAEPDALQNPTLEQWSEALDDSFCQVVAGTFGKRQGLEMQSDMGPFCHVLQV